jgi:hypothetical protein
LSVKRNNTEVQEELNLCKLAKKEAEIQAGLNPAKKLGFGGNIAEVSN